MKKILIALIAVLILGLITFFSLRGQFSEAEAARLLPDHTALLVNLSDLPRTAMRWQNSTMAQIAAESEVADFLAKPLATLSEQPGGDDAFALLGKLKPGRIFLAVPSFENESAHTLIGFQYWGSKDDYTEAVTRLRRQVHGGSDPALQTEKVGGFELEFSEFPGGDRLYSGTTGRWGFLANNAATIADALARAGGASPSPSLADNPLLRETLSKCNPDPDLDFFLVPGPILDFLVQVGNQLGATMDPAQLAEARKAEAIGFTFRIDGKDFRDAIYVKRARQSVPPELTHPGMQFSNDRTIGFFNFRVQLARISEALNHPAVRAKIPADQLDQLGILQHLPEAFGDEMSILINWAEGSMIPRILGALPVLDEARAQEFMMNLSSLVPETSVDESEGTRVYSFPSLRSPFLDPCIGLRGNLAVAALTQEQLRSVLTADENQALLSDAPTFSSAKPQYLSANEAFGYIDTKAVFENGFPMARQMISFAVALMPEAATWIDTSRMPSTESIARHLTPMVYSQTATAEGLLIESCGPITMNQAGLLTGILSSVFLSPKVTP